MCVLICGGVFVFKWLIWNGNLCKCFVSVIEGGLLVWFFLKFFKLIWIWLFKKVFIVSIIDGVLKWRFICVIIFIIWLFLIIRLLYDCWKIFKFFWCCKVCWIVVLYKVWLVCVCVVWIVGFLDEFKVWNWILFLLIVCVIVLFRVLIFFIKWFLLILLIVGL